MEFVKPPEAFIFDGANTPQRWARWEKAFNTYFVAAELNTKAKAVQVARLLNAAGMEAQEIHETFTFANDEEKAECKVILKKFADYCPFVFVDALIYKSYDRFSATFQNMVLSHSLYCSYCGCCCKYFSHKVHQ